MTTRENCTASCWNAKSDVSECVCRCHGENHGRGPKFAMPDELPHGAIPGHYTGPASGITILRPDGSTLDLRPSLRLANHSPTGFSWGYHGSGPGQLALAVLLDQGLSPNTALRHYQNFKRDVVARQTFGAPLKIPRSTVEKWISRNVIGR